MNKKKITCIQCPLGCQLEIEVQGKDDIKLKGNKCQKGIEYGRQEVLLPVRVLTTTIKTENPDEPLLPVRSDKPIPRDKLAESMKVIAGYTVSGKTKINDTIIRDILNTGANIIASKTGV